MTREDLRALAESGGARAWCSYETEYHKYVQWLEDLLIRYKAALEGLTPSGSEFVNEPERCAEFVRQNRESMRRVLMRANRITPPAYDQQYFDAMNRLDDIEKGKP